MKINSTQVLQEKTCASAALDQGWSSLVVIRERRGMAVAGSPSGYFFLESTATHLDNPFPRTMV